MNRIYMLKVIQRLGCYLGSRTLSIPKLELYASLLLSKLMKKVISSLNIEIETALRSDFMILHAWIKKSLHLLKTFVGNKVSSIQKFTGSYQWMHVPSESYPADMISRGLDEKDIILCDL